MKGEAEFNKLVRQADKKGLDVIICEACRIMRVHPNVDEFLMSMGSAFFIDESGGNMEEKHYTKKLLHFIEDNDDAFKYSGEGIRFKKDGKITYNW